MHTGYGILHTDNVYADGCAIERTGWFWIQMMIHRSNSLVVDNRDLIHVVCLLIIQFILGCVQH
jgi:hypothetical protein